MSPRAAPGSAWARGDAPARAGALPRRARAGRDETAVDRRGVAGVGLGIGTLNISEYFDMSIRTPASGGSNTGEKGVFADLNIRFGGHLGVATVVG